MVHSGYHPLNHRSLRVVFGLCTVAIILLNYPSSSYGSVWIVHSGYHPLKHRPLTMAFGWCTVDIILLTIVHFGWCLDGAQWISSS